MDKSIKVLVIDDSAFMRKIISDIIEQDSRCEVVGKASNGIEGLELIKTLKPDVLTVDVEMPKMNGLNMLKELYKTKKIPAVMLSAITKDGAKETLEALSIGAVDFVTKPENIFGIKGTHIQEQLIEKIITAAGVSERKITQSIVRPVITRPKREVKEEHNDLTTHSDHVTKLITIGTSTGGPKALQRVLTKVEEDIDAPILIVQHMPKGFTASLAARLNQLSDIHVKEAEDGEVIRKGVAYIAPGDFHMTLESVNRHKYKIKLDDSPRVKGHKPCHDVLLNSVTSCFKHGTVNVIMTGMGSDGTEGLSQLTQQLESYTIAQDKESCVVFGMPRSVINLGIADEVVDLNQIGSILNKKIGVI